MKRIILPLVCLLFVYTGTFGQLTSVKSDNTPQTVFAEPYNSTGTRAGECNFLVFRDNLPWGSAAVTNILAANGETFTVANSSQMATIDFSLYDVIIIESDQVPGFHTNFVANFAKFDTFVTNGGRLQVHAATCGWNSACGYSVLLPGGVFTSEQLDYYNNVVMPAHPIVAGVGNPFYGSYASHGYFSNLVPGTSIITETSSNNLPTTIQYSYGTGTITATTCTYEFGYDYGQEAGTMLVNNLNYSCEFVPAPVPVSSWALLIGIFLILAFTIIRFRRS